MASNFSYTDPVTERFSYYPYSEANDIAWRARNLLRGRTKEDISELSYHADHIVEWYYDHEKEALKDQIIADGRVDLLVFDNYGQFESLRDEASDHYDIRDRDSVSELEALQEGMESWFDPTTIDVPDPKEYELFASRALERLDEYVRKTKFTLDIKAMKFVEREKSEFSTSDLKSMASTIMDALDSVCYAERLREISKVEERYEKRIEKARQETAKIPQGEIDKIRAEILDEQKQQRKEDLSAKNDIRHGENRQVKNSVQSDFEREMAADKTRFLSAEKAADYYVDWLENQNIERGHRTVADWIRAKAKTLGIRFRP
jgi:hypothetical protein